MWDAFQREVLGAMGHPLWVPLAARVVEAAPALPTVADDAARPALLRALAVAAGVDATQVDIAQLVALPPLRELQAPAAKRLLWPRLRRLRSGQRP